MDDGENAPSNAQMWAVLICTRTLKKPNWLVHNLTISQFFIFLNLFQCRESFFFKKKSFDHFFCKMFIRKTLRRLLKSFQRKTFASIVSLGWPIYSPNESWLVIAPLYRTVHTAQWRIHEHPESTPHLPIIPILRKNGSFSPAMVPLRLTRLLPPL